MEVHFNPEVSEKLDQLAQASGRSRDELLEDAVISYCDEIARTREMLDRRFDELESGAVQAISLEDAWTYLAERTEAQRRRNNPAA